VLSLFPVLRERRRQLAGSLSGGEQQMVALGRGLMAQPDLLLLDEPSQGLGPRVVEQIFETIDRIRKTSRLTILLVEQRVIEALELCDRGYVLETGRVALEGAHDALRRPAHPARVSGRMSGDVMRAGECPRSRTLPDLLDEMAARRPAREFIVGGETRLTYAETRARVRQLAKGLYQLGVRRSDKVALLMDNRVSTLVDFAVTLLGATLVPVSTWSRVRSSATC
jgi:ABC-type multidrug transport system ATPase subunit